jgi:hypothetical protein
MLAHVAMPRLIHLAPAVLLLGLAAAPLQGAPGGELGTLQLGKWFCELPGDALAPAVPIPAESFTTAPDSTYISGDGVAGSYLLLGDLLVMTTGGLSGHRFHLESGATVRRIDDQGKNMPLRCVRAGAPAANHINRPGEPGEFAPTAKPAS